LGTDYTVRIRQGKNYAYLFEVKLTPEVLLNLLIYLLLSNV
jgi:hypothetical protein